MLRRFALLHHECPTNFGKPSHWDFMLEAEDALITWELRQLPSSWLTALQLESSETSLLVPASRLADHRLSYLDYEGPLTENRGSVRRIDRGKYQIEEQTNELLVVRLQGSFLQGSVAVYHEATNENLDRGTLRCSP